MEMNRIDLTIEGMIRVTRLKERPRTKYNGQKK